MRKIIIVICLFSFIFLSYSCSSNKKPAITIDNIKITAKEFETAFAKSAYDVTPTKDNRQNFLDIFINRKLILKEAQSRDYDKESEFLEGVQSFWEQSLLKMALNKKIKEVSTKINVSDQEVKDYYEANKKEFPDKDISDVYDRIKLQLFKDKQSTALEEWINYLRKKSKIKINHKLLGLE